MPSTAPNPNRGEAIVLRALRRSLMIAGVIALLAAGVWWAATRRESPPDRPLGDDPEAAAGPRSAPVLPEVRFADITTGAGIAFERVNGAEGEKLLPETMGGGAAFFDADGDGDQDLLLVNGRSWPWARQRRTPSALSLYLNDGQGRFRDVTAAAGLLIDAYGMGVAVGDYDNDGRVDLFLTAVGSGHLYQNRGGTFVDRTRAAGLENTAGEWGTSAAWIDYDNDGDLDLFVCNYVRWSRDIDLRQEFQITGIGRAYGPPRNFEGTFPALYRNDGGRFTDVSAAAGLHVRNPATGVPVAKSLGVAPVDVDRDGCIDLIVANDTVPNFLFRNRCDGTFEEIGARAGIAFDPYGNARSAMGIDTGELGDDGAVAVAIGNFSNEMTAVYVQQPGSGWFVDEAISSGVGAPSRNVLTFGALLFDYDLDGRLDLLTANGHLEEEIAKVQSGQQYAQLPQLFWNAGPAAAAVFAPVAAAGDLFQPMVGRGATVGDIDGDGDLDVVLTAAAGPVRLLRNDQRLGHHWVRLRLEGTRSNRDAIGASIELHAGNRVLRRQVMPTRSYLSQGELPVTFGLGTNSRVDRVRIRWPSGALQELADAPIDRLTTIVEPR